ncbi:MAG: hypothetical protein R3B68_08810 [Phycisphaerales bacterium]
MSQSSGDNRPEPTPDPVAPPRLGEALRRAYDAGEIGDVAGLDAAVLGAAGRRLGRRRLRLRPVLIGGGLAAAAGLAIAAIVLGVGSPRGGRGAMANSPAQDPSRGAARGLVSASPDDLNADGHVDILDALALARAIRTGGGPDLNGDGAADGADVDALALRVVSLGGAG